LKKQFHLNENENFGLQWVGKSYAKVLAGTPPFFKWANSSRKIIEDKFSPKNLLIKGDNLEVLKLLKNEYKDQIKMIYIDPPYNTGSESFLYSDRKYFEVENFSYQHGVTKKKAEEILINLDKKGNTHSAWLTFMYPRLYVAKDLLKKDGVIFVSIDDRELAYLRILMDEIFGEDNFVGLFKWNKTSTPPSLSNKIRQKYEYILCYEKEKNGQVFFGGKASGGDMPLLNEGNAFKELTFPSYSVEFKMKGKYKKGKYNNIELLTDLNITKEGLYPFPFKIKGRFKWSQEYLEKQIEKGTQLIVKSDKFSIRYKKKGERVKKPDDIISKSQCGVGTNADAKKELHRLFGIKNIFDYPKPVSLLKYLINFVVKPDKEDIVLDFFGGSGTTAEAVMHLNMEDGGNRRFILIQSDEKINPQKNKQAYQFLHKLQISNPGIFDIMEERVKRAYKKFYPQNSFTSNINVLKIEK
jgi:adenine specific DNA methylase Mod